MVGADQNGSQQGAGSTPALGTIPGESKSLQRNLQAFVF
jgi:hypothetical protein